MMMKRWKLFEVASQSKKTPQLLKVVLEVKLHSANRAAELQIF
jgi:hypothetical protein